MTESEIADGIESLLSFRSSANRCAPQKQQGSRGATGESAIAGISEQNVQSAVPPGLET
jgi:hypothetical protein